ncbi:FAD-dependent oxidoreductase [Leifsonia kafniensis]|uniref:FAD-dependent oxidoreductase n=1 Tax=Leifsonia kafniensis TaxID=475957 RepID=A0ABP7KXW8_9MICO
MSELTLTPDVVVVGGGPAGLTAATELRRQGVADVLVIERESAAGGIPRHSDHTGYGIRDLHRVMPGPAYAQRLVSLANVAGASIWTQSMVTGIDDDLTLSVTSPRGIQQIRPRALVLATGARERPRTARMIPGSRPQGVYTTGQLQNLVHLHHQRPGSRAVIVGAELVSWSSVLTLREAGCTPVLMTSTHDKAEAYSSLSLAGRIALRTPVATHTRVLAIEGKDRVTAVILEDTQTRRVRRIECDTVVLTAEWVPDNELARSAGIEIAPGSLSPRVDASLRTSHSGVFAIGNLVHPVDTADVAALDGRHVALAVRRWLNDASPFAPSVTIHAGQPLRWISPSTLRLDDEAPARGKILAWTDEYIGAPVVEVRQGGRIIGRRRLPWPAAPGRVFRIPFALFKNLDYAAGDVSVTVR